MKSWFGCVIFVELKMDNTERHSLFSHELENCMVCACNVFWEGLDVVTGVRPGSGSASAVGRGKVHT